MSKKQYKFIAKAPAGVQQLLAKPMNRKDFLKHLGVGSLLFLGGGMIISSLGGVDKLLGLGQGGQPSSNSPINSGYGSSVYGGKPQLK